MIGAMIGAMTGAMTDAEADVIDRLAGLAPDAPLARLRRERPEVVAATEAARRVLLAPETTTLPPTERAAVALRVAALEESAALAAHYRAVLEGFPDAPLAGAVASAEAGALPSRLVAMLDHAAMMVLDPAAATPDALAKLQEAGLDGRDVVVFSQLVAFVAYEARLLAGLALLAGGAGAPARRVVADAAVGGWTLDEVAWKPWLTPVEIDQATPEQLDVLKNSNAKAMTSPYFRTLAHAPEALRQRSRLFNAVMYGPRGLPRAERELAAVAESRINGCPYCASVHARLFAQLTKEAGVMQALLDEGTGTALSGRRRAIVDYAVSLSASPPAPTAGELAALRAAGLSDGEVLDATLVVAMFAWANRLMQTLGEPVAG